MWRTSVRDVLSAVSVKPGNELAVDLTGGFEFFRAPVRTSWPIGHSKTDTAKDQDTRTSASQGVCGKRARAGQAAGGPGGGPAGPGPPRAPMYHNRPAISLMARVARWSPA